MKLEINTGRHYDILIENDFSAFAPSFKKACSSSKVLIVTESNVAPLYLDKFKQELQKQGGIEIHTFVFKSGEENKSLDTLFSILKELSTLSFSRSDCVIALGGGVVGDVAGFASSVYMRGIKFVSVPTTLLSMIDSSVGGKTAIDFNGIKNNVGSFYQPYLVYIVPSLLQTLSKREIDSGLGEAVKYAFLSKTITSDMLSLRGKENTEKLILECLKIKKAVVEEDEFDTGKRALLNLGHTIGHIIEALLHYSIPHGVCVAKGIRAIIDISQNYYGFGDEKKAEMLTLLASVHLDTSVAITKEEIISHLASDKKSDNSGTSFVLLKDIGDAEVVHLTRGEVETLTNHALSH